MMMLDCRNSLYGELWKSGTLSVGSKRFVMSGWTHVQSTTTRWNLLVGAGSSGIPVFGDKYSAPKLSM